MSPATANGLREPPNAVKKHSAFSTDLTRLPRGGIAEPEFVASAPSRESPKTSRQPRGAIGRHSDKRAGVGVIPGLLRVPRLAGYLLLGLFLLFRRPLLLQGPAGLLGLARGLLFGGHEIPTVLSAPWMPFYSTSRDQLVGARLRSRATRPDDARYSGGWGPEPCMFAIRTPPRSSICASAAGPVISARRTGAGAEQEPSPLICVLSARQ